MLENCCALFCDVKKDKALSTFRFPSHGADFVAWAKLCGRPDIISSYEPGSQNSHWLCEKHFAEFDIIKFGSKKFLRRGSKPIPVIIQTEAKELLSRNNGRKDKKKCTSSGMPCSNYIELIEQRAKNHKLHRKIEKMNEENRELVEKLERLEEDLRKKRFDISEFAIKEEKELEVKIEGFKEEIESDIENDVKIEEFEEIT